MGVTVVPDTFTMVFFDHDEIARLAERLVGAVGLPSDADVRIEVDERVPLGRHRIVSLDPIDLAVEGGALEDPKRLRHYSEQAAAMTIGRLLLQVRDRLDPDFGAPPLDESLDTAHRVAWDVACAGRLERMGVAVQQPRARYAFRNRHGFSDVADAAFDRLWAGEGVTWAEIRAISDGAVAVRDTA